MGASSKAAAFGALLAAALSLGGCGWFGMHDPAADSPALEDDGFLAVALAHTDSQLALAQMAATKARTPSVVAYARGVAEERAGLDKRLAAAAKSAGVPSDTEQVPRIDDFAPLEGTDFERAYVAAELEDQQNNLDYFEFEAENGANPSLKKLAASEVPRLRQDLVRVAAIVKDIPFEPESDTSDSGMTSR